MASTPETTPRDSASGARREVSDVTEISSKGLLPHLTDVLHALTDSQELLLRKLQSARLKQRHGDHSSIDESQYSRAVADAARRKPTFVQLTVTAATSDGHTANHVLEETGQPIPTWSGPTEFDATHGATPESAPDLVDTLSKADTTTPSSSAEEPLVAPSHHVEPAPTRTSLPNAEHSDAEANEPADRNYNFFDELDVKLTSLRNPESDSRER